MRSHSVRLTAGILATCGLFAVAAAAVGVIGLAGVDSATQTGISVVGDQLSQAAQASDVGRQVSVAFSTSQAMMLSTDQAQKADLSRTLHEQMIPGVEGALTRVRLAHAADTPDELTGIDELITRWGDLRALLDALSPVITSTATISPNDTRTPDSASRISVAFKAMTDQLDELAGHETDQAAAAVEKARSGARNLERAIVLAVLAVWAVTVGIATFGVSRVRRGIRPARQQVEFADTLQLARDEDEAHLLLQRHLERAVPDGTVAVLNRNNSADRLEAVTALPPGSPLLRTLQHAEPQSCLAVRSGQVHEEDDRHPALLACPVCSTCPGRSSCLPLTVGGEVIGSVLVNRAAAFDQVQRQTIRNSVGQAAPVLANLRNLAIAELRAATDSLTGLPNKRAVADTLKRMLAQASRSDTPMALLLLDLDHFKDINDRFGHPIGDQALAGVGAALRSTLRDSDFAGRNGGEEFTVVLPGTDVVGAIVTAEKIRAAISEIALPGIDVRITASVGIAAYPEHGIAAERLERLADSALYVAKRAGRNRIEVAVTPAEPTLEEQFHDGILTLPRPLLTEGAPVHS